MDEGFRAAQARYTGAVSGVFYGKDDARPREGYETFVKGLAQEHAPDADLAGTDSNEVISSLR